MNTQEREALKSNLLQSVVRLSPQEQRALWDMLVKRGLIRK